MLMKIQSCVYDKKEREREKSWDQQPSKSQMDFYVSFHNLMFQFLAKKNLLSSGKSFRSTLDDKDAKWREKEMKESFLHVSFYFLMVFYWKAAWKVFLVVAEKS